MWKTFCKWPNKILINIFKPQKEKNKVLIFLMRLRGLSETDFKEIKMEELNNHIFADVMVLEWEKPCVKLVRLTIKNINRY